MNGTLFRVISILFGLAGAFVPHTASGDVPTIKFEVSLCKFGLCNPLPKGWSMPKDPASPFLSTNDPAINNALAGSMSIGDPKVLQQHLNEIASGAAAGVPQYTAEQRQVFYHLIGASIQNDVVVMLPSMRPTPIPPQADPDQINRLRDELKTTLSRTPQDPIRLMDDVHQAQANARRMQRSYSNRERAAGKFLEQEIKRLYLDKQGLLRTSESARPFETILVSSPKTVEGQAIRQRLNMVLVAESVVGVRCAAATGAGANVSSECGRFNEFADEVKLGYVVADQLAAVEQFEQYNHLMTGLQPAQDFLRGIAEGFIQGGKDLVHGLEVLSEVGIRRAMSAAADAIGEALWNLPETKDKIIKFASEQLDTLLYGTPEESGQIIGRLAFEVGSFFVPVGGVANAASKTFALGVRKLAVRAAVSTTLEQAVVAGKITSAAGRAAEKFANALPGTAARIIRQEGNVVPALVNATSAIPESAIAGFQKAASRGGAELLEDVMAHSPAGAVELAETIQKFPGADIVDHLNKASLVEFDGKYVYGSADFVEIGKRYAELDSRVASAPLKAWEGDIHRAVLKKLRIGSEVVDAKESMVFDWHGKMLEASDRMGMPGNRTMSTSIGPNARETIVKEFKDVKITSDDLLFHSRPEKFERVLDLTDSDVLAHLNLDPAVLTIRKQDSIHAYIIPNIISDLARKYNVEAIISYSAENLPRKNLFILEK